MKKNHFSLVESSEGEFIECHKTEKSKNIQGGHKQSEQDYSSNRMYGESVSIFKFFLSKLNPDCERLFQYPINSFVISSEVWFANKPIGKNTLCNMMQRISEKSGLSRIYTCHSVRASCITALFQAGIPPEQIIAITKHKNTSSLKHYISISGMSSEQKKECSSILSSSVFGQANNEIAIVPRQQEIVVAYAEEPRIVSESTNVPVSSASVAGTTSMMAKFSEIFGNCTFANCDIKFS